MAKVLVTDTHLTDIADAIRDKKSSSDTYKPSEMAGAIESIETGIEPIGTLNITENGTYDVTNYASANVNVASVGEVDNRLDLLLTQDLEVIESNASGTLVPYAFYENEGITSISLPNIEYLKERCFYSCGNLKTLLLPGLIGYTYQYMAAYCSNLETVDIHNTNYVSSYSFRDCKKITELDLHRVGNIGTYAFNGCTKLAKLIIRTDTVPTLGGTNAFTNTAIAGGTGYIYVKDELVEEYKVATNWSTYAEQIKPLSELSE